MLNWSIGYSSYLNGFGVTFVRNCNKSSGIRLENCFGRAIGASRSPEDNVMHLGDLDNSA